MRKYRSDASTETRVEFGVDLEAGLGAFEETAGLAPALKAVTDELDAAHVHRMSLRKPFLRARATMRVSEYTLDTTVRTFARAVETADGGRKGPLYGALFKDGLTALTAPSGTRQLKVAEDFVKHVKDSRAPGVEAVRTEWLPRLEDAVGRYGVAVQQYLVARKADLDAFGPELALRDEHELMVDRIMGQVRAAFPGDRARQDAVFPAVDGGGRDGGDTDEPTPG